MKLFIVGLKEKQGKVNIWTPDCVENGMLYSGYTLNINENWILTNDIQQYKLCFTKQYFHILEYKNLYYLLLKKHWFF